MMSSAKWKASVNCNSTQNTLAFSHRGIYRSGPCRVFVERAWPKRAPHTHSPRPLGVPRPSQMWLWLPSPTPASRKIELQGTKFWKSDEPADSISVPLIYLLNIIGHWILSFFLYFAWSVYIRIWMQCRIICPLYKYEWLLCSRVVSLGTCIKSIFPSQLPPLSK